MRCHQCNFDNLSGVESCVACGTRMKGVTCPRCDAANSMDSTICVSCGFELQAKTTSGRKRGSVLESKPPAATALGTQDPSPVGLIGFGAIISGSAAAYPWYLFGDSQSQLATISELLEVGWRGFPGTPLALVVISAIVSTTTSLVLGLNKVRAPTVVFSGLVTLMSATWLGEGLARLQPGFVDSTLPITGAILQTIGAIVLITTGLWLWNAVGLDSVLRVVFTQLQAGFASIQSSWQLVADGYVGHEGKEFQEVRRRIDQGIGELISMVEELETVAGLRGRMIPSQIEWLRGVNLRDKNVMVSLSPALWTISQELRLPIASAQSAWEVLANGSVKPGDEQFQPVRRAMDYSMRQLTSLMEDLEALVWLQVRMVQLHREPLRVGDLLQKVAAMLQPVLTERRQSLRIEEQTPGLVFEADSRWLTHALTSLVTRISLRGPEGSSILLTGARTNGRVRISTSNPALTFLATQLGASEQQQSFTESEQGDLRIKLCRAVVELHGGTLLVDMTPDEGTLATVELPYVPETFAKI